MTAWGYLGIFLRGEKFWKTVFDEAEPENLLGLLYFSNMHLSSKKMVQLVQSNVFCIYYNCQPFCAEIRFAEIFDLLLKYKASGQQ